MPVSDSPVNATSSTTVHRRVPLVVSGCTLFVLASLAVLDVVRGPWDHDGGYYLFRSTLIADGLRPFLDYRSIYPPLMDIFHSIPVAAGIDRYVLAVALPVVWILANAAASVALARALGFGWGGSLASGSGFLVLSIENGGNHVTLEHGVVLFTLIAFTVLMRAGALAPSRLLVCGLAVSLASLSKQNGLVAILPVAAYLAERRHDLDKKRAAALFGGLLLPMIAMLAWLSFDAGSIYHNTFERLAHYAEGRSSDAFSYHWELIRSTPTAGFLALTGLVGLVTILLGPQRLVPFATLIGAALEFAPRLLRNYTHYTLNIWPFALLLILVAARHTRHDVSRLTRAVSVTLLACSFGLMFLSQSVERWQTPGYLATLFRPAAEAVRSVSPPEQRVRLYASELIVPFLAERRPEEIEIPVSAMTGAWDGSHLIGKPLPERMPVVLVDRNKGWEEPLRRSLEEAGFKVLFDRRARHDYRITVYHPRDG